MGWAYLQILPLADLRLAEKKNPPPGVFSAKPLYQIVNHHFLQTPFVNLPSTPKAKGECNDVYALRTLTYLPTGRVPKFHGKLSLKVSMKLSDEIS